MSFERTGGLRLCKCEHPLAYHPALPKWYGATETETRCTFCDCTTPELGEFQGFRSDEEIKARKKKR